MRVPIHLTTALVWLQRTYVLKWTEVCHRKTSTQGCITEVLQEERGSDIDGSLEPNFLNPFTSEKPKKVSQIASVKNGTHLVLVSETFGVWWEILEVTYSHS